MVLAEKMSSLLVKPRRKRIAGRGARRVITLYARDVDPPTAKITPKLGRGSGYVIQAPGWTRRLKRHPRMLDSSSRNPWQTHNIMPRRKREAGVCNHSSDSSQSNPGTHGLNLVTICRLEGRLEEGNGCTQSNKKRRLKQLTREPQIHTDRLVGPSSRCRVSPQRKYIILRGRISTVAQPPDWQFQAARQRSSQSCCSMHPLSSCCGPSPVWFKAPPKFPRSLPPEAPWTTRPPACYHPHSNFLPLLPSCPRSQLHS